MITAQVHQRSQCLVKCEMDITPEVQVSKLSMFLIRYDT